MTTIRYKDYVARALGPVPRTTYEIAAAIAQTLQDEGHREFVDPHCIATNLRKLETENVAERVSVSASLKKLSAVKWRRRP